MFDIGGKIKDLRMYYGIYQDELSKDICTQGTISRIEKNEIIPNAIMLHQLALRLGVDVNYFFGTSQAPRLDYIREICNTITSLVRNENYKEALKMVRIEKRNPLFNSPELKQFLLWREGICIYSLKKDKDLAFKLLDEALSYTLTTTKNKSIKEIDILSSMAVIHCSEGHYEKAGQIYETILTLINKIACEFDHSVEIRIKYNAASIFYLLQDYKSAIKYCDSVITRCLEVYSFYLLGQTYCLKGESIYALSKDLTVALEWMEQSIIIFTQLKNENAIQHVKNQMLKLKEKELAPK